MTIDIEETIELIDFHGRSIVGESCCDDCGAPIKQRMLGRLDRMRQLIESLPEHVEVTHEERETMQ